jgi:uncharacterized membrane protein
MLRGLIAGAVVGLINLAVSLISGGVADVFSIIFFVVLGVLLDLFLGRRGALAVSIAGFAVMAGLLAVAYALASVGGGADGVRVEIQGFEGPLGVAAVLGSLAVYWVIFYAVYRIVERYVG